MSHACPDLVPDRFLQIAADAILDVRIGLVYPARVT